MQQKIIDTIDPLHEESKPNFPLQRAQYEDMIQRNLPTPAVCKNCNLPNTYTTDEIMNQIGWSIIT